jgi:hypothetical protein
MAVRKTDAALEDDEEKARCKTKQLAVCPSVSAG